METHVESIVEREFGSAAEIARQVEEGLVHDTYEVRFDGRGYVLQVADTEEDREAALARGLCCYRLLQGSAIPVPRPVSDGVHESDGRRYAILEKRPGATGERDVSPGRTRNAGECLAEIHDAIEFERAGWPGSGGGDCDVEGFDEGSETAWRRRKLRDNAGFLRDGGLDEAARRVETALERVGLPSGERESAVLCHNDFTPDNVLYEGETVAGVLDFDHAYVGNPHRDVAKAATGFWMHDPCADWDVRESFYEGYRRERELGRSFDEGEPQYRMETLAVTVGGMARMGELSAYERDFYEERIREATERAGGE